MEDHQHSQADALEQIDEDLGHVVLKSRPARIFTMLVHIEVESSDVGEREQDCNNGICASLVSQRDHYFAKLLSLPADSSLHLHKEPDDQQNHNDSLAQENKANDVNGLVDTVIEGISFAPWRVRWDANDCNEDKKWKSDRSKKQLSGILQFFLDCLGYVRVAVPVADAYRQLYCDPVLDKAHAEVRSQLHQCQVPLHRIKSPIPDYYVESSANGDQRVCIEQENGEILVLLLPHQYHPNVSQCERNQQNINNDIQVVYHQVSNRLNVRPVPVFFSPIFEVSR